MMRGPSYCLFLIPFRRYILISIPWYPLNTNLSLFADFERPLIDTT